MKRFLLVTMLLAIAAPARADFFGKKDFGPEDAEMAAKIYCNYRQSGKSFEQSKDAAETYVSRKVTMYDVTYRLTEIREQLAVFINSTCPQYSVTKKQ
jgi:hypothetical protein